MSLASYANEGVVYPALFDGRHYGGTRWMPLQILVNGAAARATGEYLTSGKVVGGLLMAALVGVMVVKLWRMGCPRPIALALAATVVTTKTGLQAGTTIGGDVLPVAWQVAAVGLMTREKSRWSAAGAGALAALALAAKLTAVWALLASIVWLAARRRWRSLSELGASFAAVAAVLLVAVQVASDGRMLENLTTFAFAGVSGAGGLARAPNQVLYNLEGFGLGAWALLPFAAVAMLTVGGWKRLSLLQLALLWSLAILLVVYMDIGTGFNQVIDVVVLTLLVVGELAARWASRADSRTLVLIVGVAVLWAAGTGIVLVQVPEVREAAADLASAQDVPPQNDPVLRAIGPGDEVLSEDPYVALLLGRRPVVLDPFMLLRLERTQPEAVTALVERIDRRDFDVVVLVVSLEPKSDYWWTDYHFGTRVVAALRQSYEFDETAGRYYVYRPFSSDGEA